MKTYEIYYYGLGGEDFEGTLDWEFSDRNLKRIKQAYDDGWQGFDETDDLQHIYAKMIDAIADFGMENWENILEIYDSFGGKGIKHKTAMKRYLEDCGVSIPFPDELIEEMDDEE